MDGTAMPDKSRPSPPYSTCILHTPLPRCVMALLMPIAGADFQGSRAPGCCPPAMRQQQQLKMSLKSGLGSQHKQPKVVCMMTHSVGLLRDFHGCEALRQQLPEQVPSDLGPLVEGKVNDALGSAKGMQAVQQRRKRALRYRPAAHGHQLDVSPSRL